MMRHVTDAPNGWAKHKVYCRSCDMRAELVMRRGEDPAPSAAAVRCHKCGWQSVAVEDGQRTDA